MAEYTETKSDFFIKAMCQVTFAVYKFCLRCIIMCSHTSHIPWIRHINMYGKKEEIFISFLQNRYVSPILQWKIHIWLDI